LGAALWIRRWSLWSTIFLASGSGLSPTCSQSSLPFLCLFTDSLALRLVPWPPPFLQCTFSIPPSPSHCHAGLQFAVAIQFFSFVGGGVDQSAQGICLYMFLGVNWGVLFSVWCSTVSSVKWQAGRLGARGGGGSSGEKWLQIFSV
jgi:hypothetical protein